MNTWKTVARSIIGPTLYHGWYRWNRAAWAVSRSGAPLREGVTAVISARNEEYTIPFCLESLLGFADEIVCIDNGSTDGTLSAMRSFERQFGGECQVKILERPGATLGECREAGLDASTRTWHLRWDADMVARTTGPYAIAQLRAELFADPRPRTIQLSRINLKADLAHCSRLYPVVDDGEPFLMTFGKDVRYVEDGRFDVVRVPLYYRQVIDPRHFIFHCASLKSDENLLHRDSYFDWREAVNSKTTGGGAELARDYAAFRNAKELRHYGTSDPRAIKHRFWRQAALTLQRYDEARFGEYPEVLRREIARGTPRFQVTYDGHSPSGRRDLADPEMLAYQPTPEDRAWDPALYLRTRLGAEELRKLGL